MLDAGVDVVRLNLSHGDVDEHLARLDAVRRISAELDRHVAVLADLPGPKIRAGHFPEGGVAFSAGSLVCLRPGTGQSDGGTITVPYETLLEDLQEGSRVQLGDGAISMRVVEVEDRQAIARVETGGRANGQPGVHLSSDSLRLTAPTDDDLELAETMASAGVEYMAVSFVRRPADVEAVRAVVGRRAHLVAKIETRSSVDHLYEIVDVADAVMVARGDLGIDCPIEDVPHLQKRIVRHCVEVGVPVITATQMLESMITAPSPTRAEVSDVANAVFDGTDAVMLSGETAIGRDPVAVVSTMAAVALRAESEASYRQWAVRLGRVQRNEEWQRLGATDRITTALTHAAWQAAMDVGATAILCCTRSGRTARAMARFRPEARMIGLSPDPVTVRRMSLSWGVDPVEVETYQSTDEMVWFAVERALANRFVERGETVLVLAGAPRARADQAGEVSADEVAEPGSSTAATDVLRIVRVD